MMTSIFIKENRKYASSTLEDYITGDTNQLFKGLCRSSMAMVCELRSMEGWVPERMLWDSEKPQHLSAMCRLCGRSEVPQQTEQNSQRNVAEFMEVKDTADF